MLLLPELRFCNASAPTTVFQAPEFNLLITKCPTPTFRFAFLSVPVVVVPINNDLPKLVVGPFASLKSSSFVAPPLLGDRQVTLPLPSVTKNCPLVPSVVGNL